MTDESVDYNKLKKKLEDKSIIILPYDIKTEDLEKVFGVDKVEKIDDLRKFKEKG